MLRDLRRVRRGAAGDVEPAEAPRRSLKEILAQAIERVLEKPRLAGLEQRLAAADLDVRAGEFLLLSMGLGILGLLLSLLFGGGIFLLLAVVLAALPFMFLASRSHERQRQISRSLPDMLGSAASALRAGFSLLQAFESCGGQTSGPLGQEVERMLAETRVGVGLDEALEHLAVRAGSPDLDMMVTAVQIQRQVGGNLAEVLDRIEETIRERVRLQGEVRALSAQGRISSLVVGLLPPGLLLLMTMIAPTFVAPMFAPGIGRLLLALAGAFEVAGFWALGRVSRIEV